MRYDTMLKGTVFHIQRFSLQDGPGIRTTVFLQGCPLSCAWCHNPEGKSIKPVLMLNAEKCVLCGACAAVCPKQLHTIAERKHTVDRAGCLLCGACTRACVYGALELSGREYTSDDVVKEILRDRDFYVNGGGVTFSGGEPLLQADFLIECMEKLHRKGLHICLETSGFASAEILEKVLHETDLFLFDIKETDSARHRKYTGQDNALILKNLRYLNDRGAQIVLRCPIIDGVNLREEHFTGIAVLASELNNVIRVELEAYHPLGIAKAEQAGLIQPYTNPDFLDKTSLEPYAEAMRSVTDKPIVIA